MFFLFSGENYYFTLPQPINLENTNSQTNSHNYDDFILIYNFIITTILFNSEKSKFYFPNYEKYLSKCSEITNLTKNLDMALFITNNLFYKIFNQKITPQSSSENNGNLFYKFACTNCDNNLLFMIKNKLNVKYEIVIKEYLKYEKELNEYTEFQKNISNDNDSKNKMFQNYLVSIQNNTNNNKSINMLKEIEQFSENIILKNTIDKINQPKIFFNRNEIDVIAHNYNVFINAIKNE